MHRDGRHVFGNASAKSNDAGDIGGLGGLPDASKDHFVDDGWIKPGPSQQSLLRKLATGVPLPDQRAVLQPMRLRLRSVWDGGR